MRALKLLTITVIAVTTVALPSAAALADGPWGDVNCDVAPNDPQCQIVVVDPGSGGNDNGGGSGGPLTCRLGGEVVPCYEEGFGWLGSGGCYYGKDGGGFLPPNEYIKTCYDPATGQLVYGGVVYLADPPAALSAMIRRAVSRSTSPRR